MMLSQPLESIKKMSGSNLFIFPFEIIGCLIFLFFGGDDKFFRSVVFFFFSF